MLERVKGIAEIIRDHLSNRIRTAFAEARLLAFNVIVEGRDLRALRQIVQEDCAGGLQLRYQAFADSIEALRGLNWTSDGVDDALHVLFEVGSPVLKQRSRVVTRL